MEKQGVIKEGLTPAEDLEPNQSGQKAASDNQLEEHITKRLGDAVEQKIEMQKKCGCSYRGK